MARTAAAAWVLATVTLATAQQYTGNASHLEAQLAHDAAELQERLLVVAEASSST